MTIRLLEDLTDFEKLGLIPLSYSRISTLEGDAFSCLAKYFYTYIIGEPRQFGEAATLGNIIHDVLENKLEANETITEDLLDQLYLEFEERRVERDPDNEISEELIEIGKYMLTEFVDRHSGDSFPIESKEMEFQIVVGRGLINGFIDRVDIKGNRLIITDYKSGKNEVAQKHVPTNLQLGIYALAASKLYPGKEVYAQLYYLRSGKMKGHLFSEGDLSKVEQRLVEIADKLTTIQNYPTTSNVRVCYWCDHAKSGVCTVGAKRINR